MPNKKHETDGVPERLRQITIETLPIEIPYVLDIEPFVEPQEVMYIDKTQDRLVVDARQPVKPLEVVELSDDETVIFTSVWGDALRARRSRRCGAVGRSPGARDDGALRRRRTPGVPAGRRRSRDLIEIGRASCRERV